LIRYMRPELEALIQRATRAEHAQKLAETLQQFFVHGDNAYAWLGNDGAVREMSPSAEQLFGGNTTQPNRAVRVPAEIVEALRRLHPAAGRARRFLSVRTANALCILVSLGADAGALVLAEPVTVPDRSRVPALTPRESEVLRWIGEGKTNAEIGVLCGISPRTVGRHCENLYAKLGVESRHAAALFAREGRE
jgi:DNA-binding CsgD family transcriptional regulator